jgi:hypothetical protein
MKAEIQLSQLGSADVTPFLRYYHSPGILLTACTMIESATTALPRSMQLAARLSNPSLESFTRAHGRIVIKRMCNTVM